MKIRFDYAVRKAGRAQGDGRGWILVSAIDEQEALQKAEEQSFEGWAAVRLPNQRVRELLTYIQSAKLDTIGMIWFLIGLGGLWFYWAGEAEEGGFSLLESLGVAFLLANVLLASVFLHAYLQDRACQWVAEQVLKEDPDASFADVFGPEIVAQTHRTVNRVIVVALLAGVGGIFLMAWPG